jgi:hypothetical protein
LKPGGVKLWVINCIELVQPPACPEPSQKSGPFVCASGRLVCDSGRLVFSQPEPPSDVPPVMLLKLRSRRSGASCI